MRLHHRMAFVGRGIGRIDLNFGCGKRAVKISHSLAIGLAFFVFRKRGVWCEFRKVKSSRTTVIAGPYKRRGRSGLLKCFRDHARNRLMIMGNVASTEQRGVVGHAFANRLCFGRKDNSNDTRRCARCLGIHCRNPSLCDCRSDDIAIGLVRCDIVPFIGIGCLSGGLERPVNAWRRFANDF